MSTLRPTLTKKRLSWLDMNTSSSHQKIRITRRIVQLQQDKFASKLLDEGKQLCCEYVDAKLQREGLKRSSGSYWTSNSAQSFGENWPTISTRVQEVGWMLEECYPRLYTDISQHVNVPFTSEEVVHDLFRHVCSEILSDGVNWARIVAVFQFAGALATECYKDSRSVYVNDISSWMYELTAMYLIDWIKRRGGWVRLRKIIICISNFIVCVFIGIY